MECSDAETLDDLAPRWDDVEARRRRDHDHSLCGSILLLTERRTDTRSLRAALEAMALHPAGRYGFLDFEGLRNEGSADPLPMGLVSVRSGYRPAVFRNHVS
jgi:hypothetical protein